jgi:hypothetical protein
VLDVKVHIFCDATLASVHSARRRELVNVATPHA